MIKPQKKFMLEAIRQAKSGRKQGDYGIGAVVVKDGKIIVACNSRSKRDENPVAHAEILAIIEASKILKNRHMPECILYSTHEPCPMCTSSAIFAKFKGIVYGARIRDMQNHQSKSHGSKYLWRTIDISCKEVIGKSKEKIDLVKDFMRKECIELFHN